MVNAYFLFLPWPGLGVWGGSVPRKWCFVLVQIAMEWALLGLINVSGAWYFTLQLTAASLW